MQEIAAYICLHLHDNAGACKIKTIAGKFLLSETALKQKFRAAYGMPIGRYIIHCRIELIKYLLRDSSMPIKEIAHRAGYPDLGNFSRNFKANVGTPPRKWRSVNTVDTYDK